MDFLTLITYLDNDMTIHVMDDNKTLYFGTVRNAFSDLDDKMNWGVHYIFNGFGGLCIDIRLDEVQT